MNKIKSDGMSSIYDMELDRVIDEIRKHKSGKVCIQLPDGLKPMAAEIHETIKNKTGSDVLIWAGSCYGACDIPLSLEKQGIGLLIQWGHGEWHG